MRRLGFVLLAALAAGWLVGGGAASAAGPSVSIVGPSSSSVTGVVTAKVLAGASATSVTWDDGVEWLMAKQPDGSWTYSWDTTTMPDQVLTVTVRATDGTGTNTTTKAFYINNCTSTATIGAPAAGSTITGTTTVTGTATPDPSPTCVGLQGVVVYVDGAPVGNATLAPDGTSFSYTWDSATVSNGTHTLQVAADDGAPDVKSAAVSVTTDNTGASPSPSPTPTGSKPTVNVSNPDALAGRPVTISGQATPGSTVTLWTRDATRSAYGSVATTQAEDVTGNYSFTRSLAYNTTLYVDAAGAQSDVQTVLLKVKVTIDKVAYKYKDSRGKCVVQFSGGTYPYIPGALTYIRTTSGTPVGGTKVVQYGASGRYTALFGLSCGQTYSLFPLIAGRTSTGAVYTDNGTGSVTKVSTPR